MATGGTKHLLVADDPWGRKAYFAIGGEWTLFEVQAHIFDDTTNLKQVMEIEQQKDCYHSGYRKEKLAT